jgi:MtrB/PioB family decaheme-associated outer membrane protein
LRNNLPYDITQDRFKLSADYRGPGSLKASAGAEYDVRDRNYREAVTTREATVWGRIALQPRDDLSLGLKLAHAERDHSTYGISVWIDSPQNLLLRKYNLAERQRDTAGLRADYTVNDKVSLGIGVDYANDDYGRSAIGLTDGRSLNLNADLSVALSEKTRVHLFAQAERVRSRQAGSQAVAAPDWTASTKDRVDLLGMGIKHALMADKLDVGADLMFTRSNSDVTVDTGVGGPLFPTATTALDSLKLYATYKLQDNLSLTGSFWYEDYQARDWRLDGVLPATVSNLLVFGEQAPRYRVSAVHLALRYRF